MNVVLVYLRLFGEVVLNTGKALLKAPWTLALPMGLAVAFMFLALLLSSLGSLVGGFLLGLAQSAAFSAYLYFTGEVVAKSAVTLAELRKSFGVYFWSVIGLGFVLWIADIALNAVLPNTPQTQTMLSALWLVAAIALNAAPETIYVKGTRSGTDTIMTSFRFLQEHSLLWLLPNAGLIALGWYSLRFVPDDLVGRIATLLLLGALFHLAMIFRGTLYVALDGSTHRQRMYRYRRGA